MTAKDKNTIKKVNEGIFLRLEEIMKKLNKRFNLRFYAAVYSDKHDYMYCIRIRKTLSKDRGLNQEELQGIDSIFKELNLSNDFADKFDSNTGNFLQGIRGYLDQRENINISRMQQEADNAIMVSGEAEYESDEIAVTKASTYEKEDKILYSNLFGVNAGSKKYNVVYVIEIRNVDYEIVNIFYRNPQYSFLRMVLDNYFYDYYDLTNSTHIKLGDNDKINIRYNEDAVNFLRRMARVFLGKIQSMLKDGTFPAYNKLTASDKIDSYEKMDHYNNKIDNLYYTFNLFEDIEDISNRTYEGSNPFGSILFLSEGFDDSKNNKIKYALKFKESDRIKLADSKRIRKLLETTNCEKELYLIANHHEIIGLGEVSWNDLDEDDSLIRLDFKGLSKYDLICMYTRIMNYTSGKLSIEDNKKLYKCGKNLEIVEDVLITVIFKNPKVKEEEYSPEKFKKVFESVFCQHEIEGKSDLYKSLEKIEKVVRKAREQKHGTMVVITEPETAERELKALGAQSTLIEPKEIAVDYVKYLTSIDGAIYFDTKGRCHAIGVILDGIASEGIGDPGRGARYNSAYKYLDKLKNYIKKDDKGIDNRCVIVIISEDGMVDIIPDLDNERKIQNIIQEIIYLINEENNETGESLKRYEEELKNHRSAIEYYLYFEIAEEFYNKKKYEKACEYYELGFKYADQNSVIVSTHFNRAGNSYYGINTEDGFNKSVKYYKDAIKYSNSIEHNKTYYANLGNAYYELGNIAKSKNQKNKQKEYCEKSIEAYNEHFRICRENGYEITSGSYNIYGIACAYLGYAEKNISVKNECFWNAVNSYTKAIDIKKQPVLYWNRGISYLDLLMHKEALQDFIANIAFDSENEKTIKYIKDILKTKGELAEEALEFYKNQCDVNKSKRNEGIEKIIAGYIPKSKSNDNTSEHNA
ncbi:MAG: tetratricopeptide repeat protein [Bacillota bacterium]